MRRTLLLLPALALTAPMLAGCGEDGDGVTTVDAVSLIRSSPEAMADVGSAHMEMTMEVDGESIQAEGGFESTDDGERGTMTMQLPAPVNSSLEMVFDGTTYYMSADAFGPMASQLHADWVRFDVEALAEMSGIDLDQIAPGGGASNPTSALDGLEGISEDGVEDLGTEDVRGVSTHHYAAEIDMEAAIDQLGDGAIDAELADRFQEAYGDEPVPVEVWIDDDGLGRRMTMDMTIEGEDASMEVEMFDFGEPVDIEIPAEGDTIDFMDLLGDLRGD
jgi:hypothetical protein